MDWRIETQVYIHDVRNYVNKSQEIMQKRKTK